MRINREKFMELMAAAFNVCPSVEPDGIYGINYTDAALTFACELFDQLEKGGQGTFDGMAMVMKLFTEINSSPDPSIYMQEEIAKGWNQDPSQPQRFGFKNAGIKLPVGVKKSSKSSDKLIRGKDITASGGDRSKKI